METLNIYGKVKAKYSYSGREVSRTGCLIKLKPYNNNLYDSIYIFDRIVVPDFAAETGKIIFNGRSIFFEDSYCERTHPLILVIPPDKIENLNEKRDILITGFSTSKETTGIGIHLFSAADDETAKLCFMYLNGDI